jgi:hypothetical protein
VLLLGVICAVVAVRPAHSIAYSSAKERAVRFPTFHDMIPVLLHLNMALLQRISCGGLCGVQDGYLVPQFRQRTRSLAQAGPGPPDDVAIVNTFMEFKDAWSAGVSYIEVRSHLDSTPFPLYEADVKGHAFHHILPPQPPGIKVIRVCEARGVHEFRRAVMQCSYRGVLCPPREFTRVHSHVPPHERAFQPQTCVFGGVFSLEIASAHTMQLSVHRPAPLQCAW